MRRKLSWNAAWLILIIAFLSLNVAAEGTLTIYSPADNLISRNPLSVLFNYTDVGGGLQCGLNVNGAEIATGTKEGINQKGINVTTYGGIFQTVPTYTFVTNPENANDNDTTTYSRPSWLITYEYEGFSYLLNFTIPLGTNQLTNNFKAAFGSGNQWATLFCKNKSSGNWIKISPTIISSPYVLSNYDFAANNSCFNNTDTVEFNMTFHSVFSDHIDFYEMWINYTFISSSVTSGQNYTISYSPSTSGNYSWNISCNNTLGGTISSALRSFIFDVDSPAVTGANAIPNTVKSSTTINVTATITDTYGISTVSLNNNQTMNLGGGNEYSVGTNASNLGCSADGLCVKTIYATDLAGNINSANSVNLYIDNTPPTINIDVSILNNSNISNSTYTMTFNVTDNNYTSMSLCLVYLNGDLKTTLTPVGNNTQTSYQFTGVGYGINQWYVTCYDGLSNQGTSGLWKFTRLNSAPSINSIHTNKTGVDMDNLYLFNHFFFIAAISDPENDTLQVNFSVLSPNGSTSIYNASMLGTNFTSDNYFISSTGTYYVNISTSDNYTIVNLSKNFTIASDTINVSSSYSQQIIPAGQNVTFDLEVDSNTNESLVFNSSCSGFNLAYFWCSFSPDPISVSQNGTIHVTVNSSASTPVGNYSGYILVNRSVDGKLYNFSVPISISVAFGSPLIINKTDWSTSITSSDSTSNIFNLTNNGTYQVSNCHPSLDGDFVAWSFVSFSHDNFVLAINQSINLTLTFSSPPPATYRGHLNVDCVATPDGVNNSLQSSNRPYVQLVSTSSPVVPGGGGGGGTTTVVVPEGANETLFTISTDTGDPSAAIFMFPGQKRKQTFILKSSASKEVDLKISCDGNFCQYVKLGKSEVKVYPGVQEFVTAELTVPSSAIYGSELSFKIIASDSSQHSSVVQVSVQVNKLIKWYSKFGISVQKGDPGYWFSMGGVGIPKILLYLLVIVILEVIVYLSIPKDKNFHNVATIIYISIGLVGFIGTSIFY